MVGLSQNLVVAGLVTTFDLVVSKFSPDWPGDAARGQFSDLINHLFLCFFNGHTSESLTPVAGADSSEDGLRAGRPGPPPRPQATSVDEEAKLAISVGNHARH